MEKVSLRIVRQAGAERARILPIRARDTGYFERQNRVTIGRQPTGYCRCGPASLKKDWMMQEALQFIEIMI